MRTQTFDWVIVGTDPTGRAVVTRPGPARLGDVDPLSRGTIETDEERADRQAIADRKVEQTAIDRVTRSAIDHGFVNVRLVAIADLPPDPSMSRAWVDDGIRITVDTARIR